MTESSALLTKSGADTFLSGLPYMLDVAIGLWNASLGAKLNDLDLSFEQWRLMMVAAEKPPMTIRDLSNLTMVPHSTIGRWVATLERQGLLERSVDPQDNRAFRIGITEKGKEFYASTAHLAEEAYAEGTRGFAKEEIRQLQSFIERLIANNSP